MKRKLRHPIRAIREPFGTAGLIVAMIALLAALGGTAFAAAKLNSTQKKEVEKIAKKFAGKPGAAGANGTNGTNGSPGAKGDPGSAGNNGSPGAAGKSVVASAAAVPGECPTGTTGTKFEVEGSGTPSHVCSGKNGTTGFTEALPSGKTETGTWAAGPEAENVYVPISFNIPLEAGLQNAAECGETGEPDCVVNFIKEGEAPPPGCAGGTVAAPTAEPGNLCVYTGEASFLTFAQIKDPSNGEAGAAATSGATLQAVFSGAGEAFGTWAVTAE